jgi:hypothetical protein
VDTRTLTNWYQQPDVAMLRAVAEVVKPSAAKSGSEVRAWDHNNDTHSHTLWPHRESATSGLLRSRFQLPFLGSSQDSPDPASGGFGDSVYLLNQVPRIIGAANSGWARHINSPVRWIPSPTHVAALGRDRAAGGWSAQL